MRRRPPAVERELPAAIRRVGALYSRLPEAERPDVNGPTWHVLEAELDRCCVIGDRPAALAALDRWEQHARRVLTPREAAA